MYKYLEVAAARRRGKEWLGVRDVAMDGCQKYDMTNLPMKGVPDQFFDGIYSEHFVEHLFKYQTINFLKEGMRILKYGGIIRTVWPPYDFVEKLISNEKLEEHEKEFVLHYYQNYVVRHNFAPKGFEHKSKREQCALGLLHQNGEHRYLWTKKEFIEACKDAGYVNVKEMPYNKSTLPAFNNIETPCRIREAHSAIVEAVRP
jgi:ubiquinone/menaquinone biosynthesis C-methylase UbiE